MLKGVPYLTKCFPPRSILSCLGRRP